MRLDYRLNTTPSRITLCLSSGRRYRCCSDNRSSDMSIPELVRVQSDQSDDFWVLEPLSDFDELELLSDFFELSLDLLDDSLAFLSAAAPLL